MRLVLALTLLSSIAFAEQPMSLEASEYFHQPASGAVEVVPHAGYRTLNSTPSNSVGGATQNLAGLDRLGANVGYGVMDALAVGFDYSYSKYNVDPAGYAEKGSEPLDLWLKARAYAGVFTIHYGLDLSFGLERARVGTSDYANRSWGDAVDGLNAGSFRVAPFIGFDTSFGASSAGARLAIDVVNSHQSVDFVDPSLGLTATTDINGASRGRAAIFYEYRAADVPLGLALTYDWFTSVNTYDFGVNIAGHSGLSLIGTYLYADLPLGGFDFLPSITWRERASSDDFQKTSDIHLTVAGRWAF